MGMVNVEIILTCVVKNAERVRFILGNAVKNEITCDDSPVLLLFLAPSKKRISHWELTEYICGKHYSLFPKKFDKTAITINT